MLTYIYKWLSQKGIGSRWLSRKGIGSSIWIGAHELMLQPDNKHEIAYLDKYRRGIVDVDVAIGNRLFKPGDVALDLGANIGYVSLHMIAMGAKEVHAFEPHPAIFKRLQALKTKNLFCYPFAISDKSGVQELILSVTHNQGSTLYPEVVQIRPQVFGEVPVAVKVETRTIDEIFSNKQFDYMKVDIEGGELDFIRGAHNLLTLHSPRILAIEIKPEFRDRYLKILGEYFSFAWRVDYNRITGDIKFMSHGAPSEDGYLNQPPNFIFSNDVSVLN